MARIPGTCDRVNDRTQSEAGLDEAVDRLPVPEPARCEPQDPALVTANGDFVPLVPVGQHGIAVGGRHAFDAWVLLADDVVNAPVGIVLVIIPRSFILSTPFSHADQMPQRRTMFHPARWAAIQMLHDLGQEGLATLRQKLGIVLHDGKALIASEVRRFFLQKLPQYF
jgi:hypothetical protein